LKRKEAQMKVPPLEVVAGIQATRALFQERLCQNRDFSVFEQVYAQDATVIPSWAPTVSGRNQILKYWRAAAELFDLRSAKLAPYRLETIGPAHVLETGMGSIAVLGGKSADIEYLALWVEVECYWKVYMEMWNLRA
jgi:ketosteroid isomerase-like protein